MNKIRKKDLYIRVLQYAHEHQEGFTLTKLGRDLQLGAEENRMVRLEMEANPPRLFQDTRRRKDTSNEWIYVLTIEDEFRLLEYTELKEARSSSFWALVIAIFAIIISIGVAVYQIFIPTEVIVIEDRTSSASSVEQVHIDPQNLNNHSKEIINP